MALAYGGSAIIADRRRARSRLRRVLPRLLRDGGRRGRAADGSRAGRARRRQRLRLSRGRRPGRRLRDGVAAAVVILDEAGTAAPTPAWRSRCRRPAAAGRGGESSARCRLDEALRPVPGGRRRRRAGGRRLRLGRLPDAGRRDLRARALAAPGGEPGREPDDGRVHAQRGPAAARRAGALDAAADASRRRRTDRGEARLRRGRLRRLRGVRRRRCGQLVLGAGAAGRGGGVETVAGLAAGELHPLQAEMVARGGVQCGFCTPGMVLGALEAVRIGAAGSEAEIRHSLAGNLCRCTGYGKIVSAVAAYRDGEAGGRGRGSRPERAREDGGGWLGGGWGRAVSEVGRRRAGAWSAPSSPATTRSRRSRGGPRTRRTSRCRGCCTRC